MQHEARLTCVISFFLFFAEFSPVFTPRAMYSPTLRYTHTNTDPTMSVFFHIFLTLLLSLYNKYSLLYTFH